MGFGALIRNVQVTQTDTVTGTSITDLIVTGTGAYPEWKSAGAYDGGMGIPGASRAVTLLADLAGAAPWHAYRDGPAGVAERVAPTPLLLEQPAPPDHRVTTISSMVMDLVWHGNAIGLHIGGSDGLPDSILPIPARTVHVTRVAAGSGIDLPVGNVAYQIGRRWYDSSQVMHVKGPCEPGALRGWGVLENHQALLRTAEEQRRQAGAATGEGIPTGVLTSTSPDTTVDQLRAAKAAWLDAQRTRTIAALGPGTNFEALAWSPTEAQLLEARRFTLHEIGLAFGVPLHYLGVEGGSRTYSNVEQEGIELVKSLRGHLARFEAAFSAMLPHGQWARANLDAELRADTLARYRAHKMAIDARFLAPSEARALENRPPMTAAQLGERYPDDAPAGDEEDGA